MLVKKYIHLIFHAFAIFAYMNCHVLLVHYYNNKRKKTYNPREMRIKMKGMMKLNSVQFNL